MMHGYNLLGGWFHPGWIFQILILLVFFFVLWWLLREGALQSKPRESPEEILTRRLASGEITAKQYRELKKEMQ